MLLVAKTDAGSMGLSSPRASTLVIILCLGLYTVLGLGLEGKTKSWP